MGGLVYCLLFCCFTSACLGCFCWLVVIVGYLLGVLFIVVCGVLLGGVLVVVLVFYGSV